MKHYKINLITVLLLSVVLMSACSPSVPPEPVQMPVETPAQIPAQPLPPTPAPFDIQLSALIPPSPYSWAYSGFAEYAHTMSIVSDTVSMDLSTRTVQTSGMVADMSGGESTKDFSTTLTYIIDAEKIVQQKSDQTFLEFDFDHLTLIKTPLQVGTTWSETVQDDQAVSVVINGTIVAVTADPGGLIYTVEYADSGLLYFEKRLIQVGHGVIAFTKTISDTSGAYDIGYYLN